MGLLLGLVPSLRRLLIPIASRRMAARRCARDQFFERGLHLTAARTGILLLVSPVDRYAEIVADAGAQGPLPEDAWRPCLETLVAEARGVGLRPASSWHSAGWAISFANDYRRASRTPTRFRTGPSSCRLPFCALAS